MWFRKRLSSLMAVGVVLSLLLSACTPAAQQPSAPTGTAPATSQPAAKAPVKQVLRIGWSAEPFTLDPANNPSIPGGIVIKHVYETLVEYDDAKAQVVPGLAEKWEISPDGKVYTFNLKKNAKFASGRPVTAHDVKFSWERGLAYKEGSQYAYYTAAFADAKIEAVDDSTVRITLKEPNAPLLNRLVLPQYSVFDRETVRPKMAGDDPQGNKFLHDNPAGSGPFVLKQWVPKERLVLARNDNYWGEKPALEEVTFRVIPEPGAMAMMLERSEIDSAYNLDLESIKLFQSKPNFRLEKSSAMATYYVALNMAQKPFDDVRVRQAFRYAINYDAIIKGILEGFAEKAGGIVPRGVLGYGGDELVNKYKHDPAKAKQLLAEAGFPSGAPIVLWQTEAPIYGLSVPQENLALQLQNDLNAAGFKVELRKQDIQSLFPRYRAGELSALIWYWTLPVPDPDLVFPMHGDMEVQATTRVAYKDAEVTRLIRQARTIIDPKQREEAYKRAQMLSAETGPYVFLFVPQFITTHNKRVQGWNSAPLYQGANFKKVTIGE